ncbi:MAG: cytochrome c oxidase assembly protein [Arenicellales bacterium]
MAPEHQASAQQSAGLTARQATKGKRNLLKLITVPVAMFGFGYLMVPLYNVFCDLTGLNGKTGSISIAQAASQKSAEDRLIKVEFMSSINEAGPWTFKPEQTSMLVHPGQPYQATYIAKNLLDVDVISQSIPSVAPSKAASHFNKTECFCFTEQAFKANEQRTMPLTFIIDPDIPEDVDTVTLSYTLFTKSTKS